MQFETRVRRGCCQDVEKLPVWRKGTGEEIFGECREFSYWTAAAANKKGAVRGASAGGGSFLPKGLRVGAKMFPDLKSFA